MSTNQNNTSSSIPSSPIYSFASSRRQDFSFPNSIIHYLTKTPSNSKGYKNLIQTCKYFTSKNHVIHIQIVVVSNDRCLAWEDCDYKNLNFDNPKFQIWIQEKLAIRFLINGASIVAPRIYRCDAEILELENLDILFEEYLIFVSSNTVKNLAMTDTIVKYKNGETLPMEVIFEKVPSLRNFFYNYRRNDSFSITSSTAKNLIKIPHFQTLKKFQFIGIPEVFDYKTFFNFSRFNLICGGFFAFQKNISKEYKKQVENYVDEMIYFNFDEETKKCDIPVLFFPDETEESKHILKKSNKNFKQDFLSHISAYSWAKSFE